ncbi:MAG: hypothetical protein DRI26_00625 [Chloroflexi bacterium]|mgnify:CR=1 FL=1|nr:MAG: hypothetical protein DRI26_00625 [Chloroflexota bacterium]
MPERQHRVRLRPRELNLVLEGLALLCHEADDPDTSDDALALMKRLLRRRPGRPKTELASDEAREFRRYFDSALRRKWRHKSFEWNHKRG